MRFLDEKFKEHKFQYIIQTLLMGFSVMGILVLLDLFAEAAMIASFGASSFIVFTIPHNNIARAKYVIGGSSLGILTAFIMHIFSLLTGINQSKYGIIYGAIAVTISMFLMVITDTEHPPGAGLALGLMLDGFDYRTAIITFLALVMLSLVRKLLSPLLIDLL